MAPAAAIEKKRFLSIDVFRGLTIAVMVFVNTTGDFTEIPAWSHHAKDYGLTYVDLVAPFFIFAIALTYRLNYVSGKIKEGRLQNVLRIVRRYFSLIGMGFFGWCIIDMIGQGTLRPHYFWGVFQAIGMAGLVTLPFIALNRWLRLGAGILLWVLYQYLIINFHIDDINFAEVHSGFWGGLGYGIMMLLATVVCDSFEGHRMRGFLIGGAAFLIAGAATAFYWGVSKNRLTGPYIFLSLGFACFVFYAIWYLYDNLQITQSKSNFFAPIGKNPFFLYILHGILTLIPMLLLNEAAAWYWVVLCGIANVLIIWLTALWLDRRGVYVSI